MENVHTYKAGVERLMELVRDTFGDRFNMYYEGDPGMIPKAAYPCVIVEKVSGRVDYGATGHDEQVEEIAIRLVLNKQDDIGVSADTDLTERKLRLLVEGRDATTGFYREGTLMHAVRTHITLDNLTVESTATVRYGIVDRQENLSSEAEVIVLLTERIQVPDRY